MLFRGQPRISLLVTYGHLLRQTWFLLDFITVIPFDVFTLAADGGAMDEFKSHADQIRGKNDTWQLGNLLTNKILMGMWENNVGIAMINHPPNHHRWVVYIKNRWFIIAIPTLKHMELDEEVSSIFHV